MGYLRKTKLPKNAGPMTRIVGGTAKFTNAGMNRPGVNRPKGAHPKGWGSAWTVRKRK